MVSKEYVFTASFPAEYFEHCYLQVTATSEEEAREKLTDQPQAYVVDIYDSEHFSTSNETVDGFKLIEVNEAE